jgi:hypothetical protein
VQVWQEAPSLSVVRVRNTIPDRRAFASDFADSGHKNPYKSVIYAKPKVHELCERAGFIPARRLGRNLTWSGRCAASARRHQTGRPDLHRRAESPLPIILRSSSTRPVTRSASPTPLLDDRQLLIWAKRRADTVQRCTLRSTIGPSRPRWCGRSSIGRAACGPTPPRASVIGCCHSRGCAV